MRRFYLLLALVLMGSGGYLIYKGKDVGAALVGAGVSAVTIQQVEAHKQRERSDQQKNNKIATYRISELKDQVKELKIENNNLKNKIERKDSEILELKTDKAVLETRLEYTNDPYYMKAKLNNPALPESSLEELSNSPYQPESQEYNEVEIDSEDKDNG